jgi:hypothetical protein
LLVSSPNNSLAGARCQVADDGGFDIDFAFHDYRLDSEKPWSVPEFSRMFRMLENGALERRKGGVTRPYRSISPWLPGWVAMEAKTGLRGWKETRFFPGMLCLRKMS